MSKRQRILEAAATCFSRMGFKKCSVDQIARAAGVAKGTVYLACDSKEDLFYQSVHRELRGWLGEVAKMIDPRVPADELLRHVAVESRRFLAQRPLVRNLIAGIYHGEMPAWAKQFEGLRELARAAIKEILTLGISQGVFRDDLNIDDTAAVLHDLQNSAYIMMARADEVDFAELNRRLDIGIDLVLNGLRPR